MYLWVFEGLRRNRSEVRCHLSTRGCTQPYTTRVFHRFSSLWWFFVGVSGDVSGVYSIRVVTERKEFERVFVIVDVRRVCLKQLPHRIVMFRVRSLPFSCLCGFFVGVCMPILLSVSVWLRLCLSVCSTLPI